MKRLSYKDFKEFQRFAFIFCFAYFMSHWISLTAFRSPRKICSHIYHGPTSPYGAPDVIPEIDDKFLLVAVMTTRKYLETRAQAIYNTWGQHVPGKIVFFVGGKTVYRGDLPVVLLEDVTEETYPPQKKAFAMLKYISTHFIDDYEWFMRVDDDVFVKTDRLETFLRSCNSSRLLYMGQPGTGVPTERGKLGLFNNAPYCLGGPGVVFTGSTLKTLAVYLPRCLNNTVTSHEDTELGRCVQKYVGLACTNAFEFSALFYQNYKWKNGTFDFKLGLAEERALTIHPLKQQTQMFHVNQHFAVQRLRHLYRKLDTLTSAFSELSRIIDAKTNGEQVRHDMKSSEIRTKLRKLEGWSTPSNPKYTKPSRGVRQSRQSQRGEIWDFVKHHKYIYSRYNMFNNPIDDFSLRGKLASYTKAKLTIDNDPRYHAKKVATFSYQRLSFGRLMENIIPVLPSPESSISLRIVQTFSDIQLMESEKARKSSSSNLPTISMILPLFKRSKQYAAFLSAITKALEIYEGNIDLYLVLYVDEDMEFESSKGYTDVLQNFLGKLTIKLTMLHEPFSRGKAINRGARSLANDTLLLIMDVDMIFDHQFLQRVLLNTIRNHQVYFPIFFSQYSENVTCYKNNTCEFEQVNFDNQYGTWRFFSYGIMSIYKDDFLKMRGFREDIKGWGKEDVEFFNGCLRSHLRVFRAADPYLIHVYHKRACDPSLPKDQQTMCVQSRYQMYGHEQGLYEISQALNLVH